MGDPVRDLVPIESPASPAVRGLNQPVRWSLYGAALGAAATAPVTLLPALTLGSWPMAGLLLSGLGSAAIFGAYLGRRWRRTVARERGHLTVAQWMARFAADGAAWGLAASMGVGLPMVIAGAPLSAVLVCGAIGSAAGSIVTGLLGVPHVLSLTRGNPPWASLALAFALGPSALVGVIMFVAFVANLLGMT